MVTFSRTKALKRRFWRVRLSEADLTRLARRIQTAATEVSLDVQITVIAADLEDAFSTEDPEFFASDTMPLTVGRVTIGFSRYDSPLSCSVQLPSAYDGACTLEVAGTDSDRATGLFRDLERELQSRVISGAWLSSQSESFIAAMTFSVVAALAVYSAFDLAERIVLLAGVSRTSQVLRITTTAAWFAITVTFFGSSVVFGKVVHAILPSVEYTGRIREKGARSRAVARAWLLAVLLPILLNVLASFIFDAIHLSPTA